MELRPIRKEDYQFVLELDKLIYPTDSLVTLEDVGRWYKYNPEFGMVYEENGSIVGISVVIPLNSEGWKQITEGKISESGITDEMIFNPLKDKELGIYMYHIEKFEHNALAPIREFYKTVIRDLAVIVNKLRSKHKKLKILGFAGLAVTKEGIILCEDKLGCKERSYICDEHVLKKEGKKYVVKADQMHLKQIIEPKIKDGYSYITRCKMLVTYPGEKSIIWEYIKP
ncbi:MAG: hypothetical protein QXE90_02860 [Candidatus Micrarchaeia archaeon]